MRYAMAATLFIVGTAAMTLGARQPPADKKDAQATYEPHSGPGEGQKFLQRYVGTWDVEKAFHPRGGGANTMRINFSYSSPEVIREGVTRLGITLKELIKEKETV